LSRRRVSRLAGIALAWILAAAVLTAAEPEWSVAAGYGFALKLAGNSETSEHLVLLAPAVAWRLSSHFEYLVEGHLAWYFTPTGYMIGIVPLGGRVSIGSGSVRPFAELGAGCGWTDLDKLPEIDRRFNFILQGGLGVRGALRDGQAWTFEARLVHYSNANTVRPNISLNSLVLLAGWRFR
jgi:hypothetical protein